MKGVLTVCRLPPWLSDEDLVPMQHCLAGVDGQTLISASFSAASPRLRAEAAFSSEVLPVTRARMSIAATQRTQSQ